MTTSGDNVRSAVASGAAGVRVITLANPPANALTPEVRAALAAALEAARGAGAVVIAAEGRAFSAATALEAAEDGPSAPDLAALCRLIEDFPAPVVVALQGAVIGPGAELALAAHARVADAEMRFVLPDVGLGLPPEAGATQRLPRLVGAAEALSILLRGRPVGAPEALAMGLVDVLAEGDLLGTAVSHAAAMPGPRPTRDRSDGFGDAASHAEAVAEARAEVARGVLPAPPRIVDCVEAAMYLPFENGLALEAVAREDLAETEEAAGLRASALAERTVAQLPPAVAAARPRPVLHLGLSGTAPHMAALALIALGNGLRVTWAEPDRDRLAETLAWIDARLEDEVRARRLTPAQRDADRARLETSDDLTAAGLVLHSPAAEGLEALAQRMPAAAQLVLNGAEGALGLGLAPSARAVELALPDKAKVDHVAAAVQLFRRLGLMPVLVGRMPVLGRRVSGAGRAALARLLAMGVPRRVLAEALDGFGQVLPALPEPDPPPPGMRAMAPSEVIRRWQAAMANEGMRMLDARVARCPADIDALMVAGHGFPRWRGGPMHQAAQRGLMVLRADMHRWQADDPLWEPHPLIDRLIGQGRRLDELNRP